MKIIKDEKILEKGRIEKLIVDDNSFYLENEYDEENHLIRVTASTGQETRYYRNEDGDIYAVTINGRTFNVVE